MIKVTSTNLIDDVFYFNPDRLVGIYVEDRITCLDFGTGHNVEVDQSPEEVSRLITEYKQRQMRLQAAYAMLYRGEDRAIIDEIGLLESEDRP